MISLRKVMKAWFVSLNPTPEQESEAERRVSICEECPRLRTTPFGHICGECGCAIRKKAFGDEDCPLGKW